MSDSGGIIFDSTELGDWFDWADRFIDVLALISQRVSLAIASSGFAIGAAIMLGSAHEITFGRVSLAVAGVFAIWFAAANIMGARASSVSVR